MRTDALLVYGATGYSGRLVVAGAIAAGLHPILGGRDEARLAPLAEALQLPYRVARLDEPGRLASALQEVRVVLHAAGPFSSTARPMLDACLAAGVHYLDLSAGVDEIEMAAARHAEARARGVMVLPGVGFDVVPSDCLAAHVAHRLPGAEHLSLGISGLVRATRGSAKAFAEYAGRPVIVRRRGTITSVPSGSLERTFDFGNGPRSACAVSWGDVATAYYTTGIENVDVYFEATPVIRGMVAANAFLGVGLRTAPWQAWLRASTEWLPEGPSAGERDAGTTVIVAEGRTRSGRTVRTRLRGPEAYTFTGMAAPAVAARVLAGDVEPGFQTPGRLFGPDFVLRFRGVSREEVD